MKKFMSLLLATAISILALTACGQKPAPAQESTPVQGSSKESAQTQESVPALDLENKPTLKLLMTYVPFDPNGDLIAAYLEEATGYHVEYSVLPNENTLTKLNTIIASKEPYDIMLLTKDLFSNTVATNAYEPLNELLPAYAPNVYERTAKGLWNNVTIDGDIKAIPQGLPNESYGNVYRIRMDLLKQAGIDKNPETPDELYQALKTVKDKLGMIPMTTNMAVIPEIASAFGMCFDGSNKFTVRDNKICHLTEVPGVKDYLTFMNKLYSEGLIDSEYAQNTGTTMQEKFFGGKAAIYSMGWWNEPTATNTIMEKAPGAELVYMNPLKNDKGEAMLPQNRGMENVVVIPRMSENKEYALDYMNTMLEDEIFKGLAMGKKDVHYKQLGENEFEPILPAFFDERGNASYFLLGTDTELYTNYWEQTRAKKDPILYREYNAIQEMADTAIRCYDPTTYMQPNKEYSELMPKVNQLTDDTFKQIIAGTKSMSEWDAFVKELNDTGLTQVKAILDEWWAKEGTALSDMIIKK